MKKGSFGILIAIYLGVLATEFFGSYLTLSSLDSWYETLVKPSWNPPNWVFGPVWTALYMLMAISVWFIYLTKAEKKIKGYCYLLFSFQLLLNFLWSFFFFYQMNPLLALIDIALLLLAIGYMIWYYLKVSKIAAYILLPYFFWVLYASSLNLGIYLLN